MVTVPVKVVPLAMLLNGWRGGTVGASGADKLSVPRPAGRASSTVAAVACWGGVPTVSVGKLVVCPIDRVLVRRPC